MILLYNFVEFRLKYVLKGSKNLYGNKSKKIKNVTGLHSNYDIPKDADLVLNTEKLTVTQSVNQIIKFLS